MNWMLPSDWADAKLAERQAFNRISEARSQAEWLKAWENWTSALQRLRQLARKPEEEPAGEPELAFESEAELKSDQAA
jgi:hypothetical protein